MSPSGRPAPVFMRGPVYSFLFLLACCAISLWTFNLVATSNSFSQSTSLTTSIVHRTPDRYDAEQDEFEDVSSRETKRWKEGTRYFDDEFNDDGVDWVDRVARGEVPAVVLRNFLSAGDVREIISGLPSASSKGYHFEGASVHQHLSKGHREPNVERFFGKFVPHSFITWQRVFGESKFDAFLSALQGAVSQLTTRRVHTAKEIGDKKEYNPFVIRWHNVGTAFTHHFDSVHAHLFDYRKKQCGVSNHIAPEPPNLRNFEVYKYGRLMSMILVLQTPVQDELSEDTTLFDLSCFEILAWNCSDIKKLGEATHHQIGVNTPQIASLLGAYEREAPKLGQGDLMIFNSNKVHMVSAIDGHRARITLGSFLSFDEDSREILMWA